MQNTQPKPNSFQIGTLQSNSGRGGDKKTKIKQFTQFQTIDFESSNAAQKKNKCSNVDSNVQKDSSPLMKEEEKCTDHFTSAQSSQIQSSDNHFKKLPKIQSKIGSEYFPLIHKDFVSLKARSKTPSLPKENSLDYMEQQISQTVKINHDTIETLSNNSSCFINVNCIIEPIVPLSKLNAVQAPTFEFNQQFHQVEFR